jgi:hypothetical protein
MAILRVRLTGRRRSIERVGCLLAHADDVVGVQWADLPRRPSASSPLCGSALDAVANLDIEVLSDEETEYVYLLTQTAARAAGLGMERLRVSH